MLEVARLNAVSCKHTEIPHAHLKLEYQEEGYASDFVPDKRRTGGIHEIALPII